jgi:hypothetical protein
MYLMVVVVVVQCPMHDADRVWVVVRVDVATEDQISKRKSVATASLFRVPER